VVILSSALTWGVTRLLDTSTDDKGPAVRITAELDPARVYASSDPAWQTYGFVSTRSQDQLGTPPSYKCREWRTWALGRGGIDADQTKLYAFLQGRPDTAIEFTGIDIEFVRRTPALRATHAYCPAGGATASPRLVDIDLDTKPPTILYAQAGDDYPARHRLLLKLNGTDTETLQIVAHTRHCDCEWRARLHAVVDGHKEDVVIDNNGKPFRTSASERSSHFMWTGKRWAPMSRHEWKQTLPVRWAKFRR
jgi:hypothetical protein